MTVADWLIESMIRLKEAGVENGRREGLIMLSDVLDKDKSWVHGHPEHELDGLQKRKLNRMLARRLKRVPLAYIRGFCEFYGRRFIVNEKVLIPRPETEGFIELITGLKLETPRIADIGAGSGAIGITLALEIPDASVHLYDIDPDAMAVARLNASQHGLQLQYGISDLLQSATEYGYDIIVANLPYVPEDMVTSKEILNEPSASLFSGKDGLDHYTRFWKQLAGLAEKPRYVLTESLETQHDKVSKMAGQSGYRLIDTQVLVQLFSLNN